MERYPTWSPDGSLIAYERPQAGSTDIFVKPVAGGEPVQLTHSAADEVSPRWSPDGRYIAFLSDRGAGPKVYLIPPLGGPERELADTNGVPLNHPLGPMPWSPDGQQLLFSRFGPSGEMAVWKINLLDGRRNANDQAATRRR